MAVVHTLELISFHTADDLELPGLWYSAPKSHKAVLFLHGNGSASVFYKAHKMNTFAQTLNAAGWGFLAFNNRGAHYIKKFRREKQEPIEEVFQGTSLEKIAECALDIDAAIAFLQSQGVTEVVLLGESTGANKICVYHHHRPANPCVGYVLVGGGDDTGLWRQALGKSWREVLSDARQKVVEGRGTELLSTNLSHQLISYQALVDVLDSDGEYNCFPFAEVAASEHLGNRPHFSFWKEINKPTLVLYGELDPFCSMPASKAVEVLRQEHPQTNLLTTEVIHGADHSFHHQEAQELTPVMRWLESIL